MDAALFRQFCELAYARAGIKLVAGKEALVSARIGKRLRALGLRTPREYLEYLSEDEDGEEIVHFLDVISTNFTYFLREPDHFALLAERAQALAAGGKREVRVWCAASSSGEEPYSIAVILNEVREATGLDYLILATDISTRVLAVARRGEYEAERLGKLTRQQQLKCFERIKGPDGAEKYRVRDELRRRIVFQRLNLAEPPFPMKGPFDFVFCRNVMIYFDQQVRQRLVAEIERLLGPGALLLIGHAETLSGLGSGLAAVQPSVYRRPVPGESPAPRRSRALPAPPAAPQPATAGAGPQPADLASVLADDGSGS